jgi:tape measure domain-containing protein
MAMNVDAMLRVAARVTGQQGVRGLADDLRKVGRAGDDARGGVDRLNGSMRALGQVGRALGFAGLVAGLTAYGARAIQAGEQSNLLNLRVESLAGSLGETQQVFDIANRAAQRFTLGQLDATKAVADLYGRLRPLGMTTQEIETMFIGVNKAVRLSGLSALDAQEAFRQLGQAMGSGNLQGDEFRSLMERIPRLGAEIVNAFNDIRSSGGLTLITRAQAEEMAKTVKEGEQRQTAAMKEEVRRRKEILEDETDEQLLALAQRYDRIRQLTDDANTDADRAEETARQKRLRGERQAIEDRFDEQRRALDREIADRRERLEEENLGPERLEALREQLEDEKRERERAISEEQQTRLDALQETFDREGTIRQRQIRDQRQERERELSAQQRMEEKQLRDDLDARQREIEAQLDKEIQVNKKANEDIILGIMNRVQVTRADLKKMASEGLLPPEILNKALERMSKLDIPAATRLREFNTAFENLTTKLGEDLLPKLTPLLERMITLLSDPKFTQAVGDLIKNLSDVVIPLIVPLMEALNAIIKAFATLPPEVREAVVKLGVMVALLKALGAIGVLGALSKVAGGLKKIIDAAMGASAAIKTVRVRDITAQGLPGGGTRALPPAGGMGQVKPPPPGLFAGFMAELGKVARALGGLLRQVGSFGGAILREVALAIPGLGRLGAAFAGLKVGATISGWLGALAPFSRLAIAAMMPFLGWVTGTLLPALVGVFSGPVGWIALGVAALVAGVVFFREPIAGFLVWAFDEMKLFWANVFEFIYSTQVKPWEKIFNIDLRKGITDGAKKWLDDVKNFFKGILDYIKKEWLKPWSEQWNKLQEDPQRFLTDLRKGFQDTLVSLTGGIRSLGAVLQNVFNSAGRTISKIFNWIARGTANNLNAIIGAYNVIARGTSKIPIPGAQLPLLQTIPVPPEIPALARGGHLVRPTLALLAEGRDPNGEYAIPGSRMDAAMAGWAQGLRGQALVNSWQNPGLAPGRSSTAPAAPATLNLTLQSGPIMQQPDGSQWVRREELAAVAGQTMDATMRLLAAGPVRTRLRMNG